jgi:DNA polymerase III epsilon subunit-like protein
MKLLLIDLETTHLNPARGSIVEIGAVTLDLNTREIDRVFDEIIKPEQEFNTNAWIFANSSLSVKDVKAGKTLDEIRDTFQQLLSSYPVIAYNQKFDFSFLTHNGFSIECAGRDPMYDATDLLKIPRYDGYKYPKVQECLNYFEINVIEPHRAIEDAELEAQIVLCLMDAGAYSIGMGKLLAHTQREKAIRYMYKIKVYNRLIREIESSIQNREHSLSDYKSQVSQEKMLAHGRDPKWKAKIKTDTMSNPFKSARDVLIYHYSAIETLENISRYLRDKRGYCVNLLEKIMQEDS